MPDPQEWPRLLGEFDRPTGVIKADYADFEVDELPLYPADGAGTHTYFRVEKSGLSTHQAVNDVAHALGVLRRDIGYAGLKDARAVARQWMSIEHVPPERLSELRLPRIRVLETTRHGNKLRLGHLKANAFRILVRETDASRCSDLRAALDTLARRGVPNYFGEQRFGMRGDTWKIGRAIVLREPEQAVDFVLGAPGEHDFGDVRTARLAYQRGDLAAALRAWPAIFKSERRALRALMQSEGRKKRAFAAIDPHTRNFYVSAYQSLLFNRVLAERMTTVGLDRLVVGDLAWRHANGAVFRVEDAEREQPRCDALEISPSGPLFGHRMTEAAGAAGEMESAVLAAEGVGKEAFSARPLHISGGRRPLRFPVFGARVDLGADRRGPYLSLEFQLPRGCYATTLLRELFRLSDSGAPGADDEGAEEDNS